MACYTVLPRAVRFDPENAVALVFQRRGAEAAEEIEDEASEARLETANAN